MRDTQPTGPRNGIIRARLGRETSIAIGVIKTGIFPIMLATTHL